MKLHRNSQKRIHIIDAVYFVTVKTLHNEPYFREPISCDLFVENLRVCKLLKGFELYGWFLGYDHFHMQFRPMGKWSYSNIMQSLKRHFTRHANVVMGISNEGAICKSRLHENYISHESDVLGLALKANRCRIQFILKFDRREPFPQFRWQKSFLDHYCRGESDFKNHLEYIAYNPTKHGLIHWPFVSTNPKFESLIDPFYV